MGFRQTSPASTPTPPAPSSAPSTGLPPADTRKKEVHGQVAMHAIIAGYKVAGGLATVLAASPDKAEEKLHTLAAQVAERIVAYTFKGD